MTAAPARVLIADDVDSMRLLLRATLEQAGFVVVAEAEDGIEALAMAERFQPDLVVLDVAMPGIDGLHAIRPIKAAVPQVRVAVITAFDPADRRPLATALGADMFCEKGAGLGAIVRQLRALCDAPADRLGHAVAVEADADRAGSWDQVKAAREGFQQVEALLRDSERRYSEVVEALEEGVLVHTASGITAANPAACALLGMSRDELVGRRWADAFHGAVHEDGTPFAASDHPAHVAMTNGTAQARVVMGLPLPHGATRWLAVSSAPMGDRGPDGRPSAAVVSFADITELRRAEAHAAREAGFVKLLQVVAAAANESSSLVEALPLALAEICACCEFDVGHAWIRDDTDGSYVSSGVWHCSDPAEFAELRAVTEALVFPPGRGLPGAVAGQGSVQWICNLRPMAEFPRSRMMGELGLRTVVASPVVIGSDVVAVLDFSARRDERPDARTLEVMEQVGIQLGRLVERDRTRAEMSRLALRDDLTGLPNRALLLDRLAHALARAERQGTRRPWSTTTAVVFLDLDRFKSVNDSLGHEAGDTLLQEVAARLELTLRDSDTAARLGGDEFVVVVEDVPASDPAAVASAVAARIAGALARPFQIGDAEVFVTASMGVAVAKSGDTPAALLRDADAAMYRAKDNGKARHELFDDPMRFEAIRRLETEAALHRAVERGELRLHYQPEIDLTSGGLLGFEALVRWQHPDRGLVAPADFIGLAEETGLIVPIGRWVIEEACRQARLWRDATGDPVRLWVNLSARQLAQPDLAAVVRRAVETAEIPPETLCLEITESVLMADAAAAVQTLDELRRLGVRLGVDDFGTGYSSLTYLRRLPVDVLKIDRSFIAGLGDNAEDEAIVAAVVGLAHSLGLQAIGEGVETEEQLAALKGLGCDIAQGFLFSPPVSADDAAVLLAT